MDRTQRRHRVASLSARARRRALKAFLPPFAELSYSQEGEDRILARIFERVANGFYVDIGAHHPYRFSNTCLLYERGWRGINVDATPGAMELFQAHRPADVNLQLGVGADRGRAILYAFDEPALNTLDEALARERQAAGYVLISSTPIQLVTLADVLVQHLPRGTRIDMLSVDVEGRDLDVLQSNDWSQFRPRVVVAEELTHASHEGPVKLAEFLSEFDYKMLAKTGNSLIFGIDANRG